MLVKTTRRAAMAVAAAGAAVLLLAGCTGSVQSAPTSPFRGFEQVGELDGGQTVWHAHGSESGNTNVLIAEGNVRQVSCLGEPRLICFDDNRATGQLVAVIAPEGTEQILVDFAGEEVELSLMKSPETFETSVAVFAGQMPPFEGDGFSWTFRGLDAAGEEIWST